MIGGTGYVGRCLALHLVDHPTFRLGAIVGRGLHSLNSKLNSRTFGNTSLTLELNLSTFWTHPRVIRVYGGQSELG